MTSSTVDDALKCVISDHRLRPLEFTTVLTKVKEVCSSSWFSPETGETLKSLGANELVDDIQQMIDVFTKLTSANTLQDALHCLKSNPLIKECKLAKLLENTIKDMEDYDRLTDGLEQSKNLIELFDACNEHLSPLLVEEIFNTAISEDGNSNGVAINAMDSEFPDHD